MAIQSVSVDTDHIVSTIDYMLESKLNDLRENQEALLSVNLNTQKALKEKLDEISSLRNGNADGSGNLTANSNLSSEDARSLVPVVEKIISEKILELKLSYEDAQKAMEKFAGKEQKKLIEKLDHIADNVKTPMDMDNVEKFLPRIRETLEETYTFLDEFRTNIETLKNNIKLHNPEFFNEQLDGLKKFLEFSAIPDELGKKIEATIDSTLKRHRDMLGTINDRVNSIYDVIERLNQEPGGVEFDKIRKLFSVKIEETRQLEKQLVETFRQMQTTIQRDGISDSVSISEGTGIQDNGHIQVILKELEETRREQENLLTKVDRLSDLISKTPSLGRDEAMLTESVKSEMEQLQRDNSHLMVSLENLKRENSSLQKQLKSYRSFADGEADASSVMVEKNRLLEECYREKSEFREMLEKEKRDKYEIIQRYETEKKELIDSLALERMQRDKEKTELELLRAEARKKKWW
jgi:hypothetical protein